MRKPDIWWDGRLNSCALITYQGDSEFVKLMIYCIPCSQHRLHRVRPCTNITITITNISIEIWYTTIHLPRVQCKFQ